MRHRRRNTQSTDSGSCSSGSSVVVTSIRVASAATGVTVGAARSASPARWISSFPLRLLLLSALLPLLSVLGDSSRPALLTQPVDASLCGDASSACNAHGTCAGLFEYSSSLDAAGSAFPYVQIDVSCICDPGWDSGGALAPAYHVEYACSQHVPSLLGLHVIWLAITLGAFCYALVKLHQSMSVIQLASAKKRAQAAEDRLAAFDLQTGNAGLPGHVTFGPSSQPQIEMSQTAANFTPRDRRATLQTDGRAGPFAAERSQLFTADGNSNPLSAGALTRGYSHSNADVNGAPALAGARESGGSISMAGGTASMRARSSRHTYQKPSFVTAALDRARAAQESEAARQRASSFAHGGNRVADGTSSPIGASFATADDSAVDFAAVMRALRSSDASATSAATAAASPAPASGSTRASFARTLSSRRAAGLGLKSHVPGHADDPSAAGAGSSNATAATTTSPVTRSRHSPSTATRTAVAVLGGAGSARTEKSQSRHLTVGDLEEDLEDDEENATKPLSGSASSPIPRDSNVTPPPSALFGLQVQLPQRFGSGGGVGARDSSASPNATSLSPQPSPRTHIHSPSAQEGRGSAIVVVSSSAVDTDDTPTESPGFGPLGSGAAEAGQYHSLPPTPQTPNPPVSSPSPSPLPPPPPAPPAVPAPATVASAEPATSVRPAPAGRTGSIPSSTRRAILRPPVPAGAAAAAAVSPYQKTSPSPTKKSALKRLSSSSDRAPAAAAADGSSSSPTAANVAGGGAGAGSKPAAISRHGSSLATSPWMQTPAGSPTGGQGSSDLASIVSGRGSGPSLLHLSDMEPRSAAAGGGDAPVLARLGTRDPLDLDEEVDFATSMGGISPFHIYRRPEHFHLAASVASSPMATGASGEAVPPLNSRHASLLSGLPRRVREESKEREQSPSLRSTEPPLPPATTGPMQRTLSSEEREAEERQQQLGSAVALAQQPQQQHALLPPDSNLIAGDRSLFTIHSPAYDVLSASASRVVSPFAGPEGEGGEQKERELQRFPLDRGQPPLMIQGAAGTSLSVSSPIDGAASLPQPSAAPSSSTLAVRPSRHSRAGSHGGMSTRLQDGEHSSTLSFTQTGDRRRRSSISPQPSPSPCGALHVPTLHKRGGSTGAGGSAGNINMLLVDNRRFTPEPSSSQHMPAPGSARSHRLRTHGSASMSSKLGGGEVGVLGAAPSTPQQPRRSSMSSPSNLAAQRALAASPSNLGDGASSPPPTAGRSVAFSNRGSAPAKVEPGHPILGTPADIADKPAFILGLSSQRIEKRRPPAPAAGAGGIALMRQGSLRVLNTWQPNVGGVEITQSRPSDFGGAGLMSQHGAHARGGGTAVAAAALALHPSLGLSNLWSLKFLSECCRHISFQYSLGACLCAGLQMAHIVSQLVFESQRQQDHAGLADHERSLPSALGSSQWLTVSYALAVLIFSAITHLFFGSHLKLAYSMVGLRGITQQQQQQPTQSPAAAPNANGGGSGTSTLHGPKPTATSAAVAAAPTANGVPLVGVLKGGATAAPASNANSPGNGTGSATGTTTPRRHSTANGRNVRVIRPGGGNSVSSKHTAESTGATAVPAAAAASGPPTLLRAPTLTGVGGALGVTSSGGGVRNTNLFLFHGLSSTAESRVIKSYMLLHCLCSGVLWMLLCWLPTAPRSQPQLYEDVVRIAFVAMAVMILHFSACTDKVHTAGGRVAASSTSILF